MKHLITCLFWVLISTANLLAQNPIAQALADLQITIQEAGKYDMNRRKEIAQLRDRLVHTAATELETRFELSSRLWESFKVFKYDSAFVYAQKMRQIAQEMDDPAKLATANIKLAFVLLSSGMFNETIDCLDKIRTQYIPAADKSMYYYVKARSYYDLADYCSDRYYAPQYINKGNYYIDSAIQNCKEDSFEYGYYRGLKYWKSNDEEKASKQFKLTADRSDLTWHERAIATSSLSTIYIKMGRVDEAIVLLAQAAMADIKSSTKETTAIFNLSELLFKRGNVKMASTCVEYAISDATFYGARQRKVQVSSILPIIEGEKLNIVESQKQKFVIYSVIATSLLIALIILAIIIFKQNEKLKATRNQLMASHQEQQRINSQLLEANKIKDEYVGYCFHTNSAYIHKIEKFKKQLEQKLTEKKHAEALFIVNNINIKQEREELFKNFDRIFLKIFPNFVQDFNALFHEEDQVKLKDNELLNTDLRIFALIRLGIADNEKIAEILEYAVNTIYTYKTKIKNKSLVSNDLFEEKIMQIKSR